jgi:hypothetical protein
MKQVFEINDYLLIYNYNLKQFIVDFKISKFSYLLTSLNEIQS